MSRLAEAIKRAQHTPTADPPRPVPAEPVVDKPTAVADPFDHRWFIRDAVQVGDAETHAPVSHHDFSDRLARKLVTDPESRPIAVEQYRRLAAALHHAKAQSDLKVVMVTSAVVAEGKSLSACNLGLTLSQSYRQRVLLIDADLRRPSLQEMFKLPPTTGLSEGLRAKADGKLPLFEVSPGLVVLPGGRPDGDPVGGLTSERLHRVVKEAAAGFDWVLIDTPPLGVVPDAALLGALADTIVLVIRAGAGPCPLVRQAIDTLGKDKIFGVLLNAADTGNVVKAGSYYNAYQSPR